MRKNNTNYFSHDCNARHDEKVLQVRAEYGWEGYGTFFALVEILSESQSGKCHLASLPGIVKLYNFNQAIIDHLFDTGLIIKDEKYFRSKSLLARLDMAEKKHSKYREAGKIGAEKLRRGSPHHSDAIASKGKERKEHVDTNVSTGGDPSIEIIEKEKSKTGKGNKRSEEKMEEVKEAIKDLQSFCESLGVAYIPDQEKSYMNHILTAKDYGAFCEKVGMGRMEFAKNILLSSFKLPYLRGGVCAGPMAVYQRHREVYNEVLKAKASMAAKADQGKGGGISAPPTDPSVYPQPQ